MRTLKKLCISRRADVHDVGCGHSHLGPHPPLLTGHRVIVGPRTKLPVKIALAGAQPAHDEVRVKDREITQEQDVVAFIFNGFWLSGVDDQRAIMSRLFLQARMAVIPIGARLPDRKLIGERLARTDARKTDARNAIHLERHQQAVPVDRGVCIQVIGDVEPNILPFTQTDQWSRHTTVDGNTRPTPSFDDAMATAHSQVNNLTAEFAEACRNAGAAASVTAPMSAMYAMALRPGRHGGKGRARTNSSEQCSPRQMFYFHSHLHPLYRVGYI